MTRSPTPLLGRRPWAALLAVVVIVLGPEARAVLPGPGDIGGSVGGGGVDGDTTRPVGVWPLHPTPEVIARFDTPTTPYGAGHRGVDLQGRLGQRVTAALGGRVTYAGRLAGKGVVVVDHGATRTTYEPVTATVVVDATVLPGEALGVLELPQSHCFPRACLHWGWVRNADDVYLDPLDLVGGGPVRLLPLHGPAPVGSRSVPDSTARFRPAPPGAVPHLRPPLLDLLHPGWPTGGRPPVTPAGVPDDRPGAADRW